MKIKGYTFRLPNWYGMEAELWCLLNCMIPNKNNNSLSKLVTLVFVSGWVFITLSMTLENVDAVRPIYYGFYTAIVFLILGRMWDIELDKYVDDISFKDDDSRDK